MDEDILNEEGPRADIPLADLQIVWDYQGKEPDAPSLLVMGHPDASGMDRNGTRDNRDYFSSWGACLAEFEAAGDIGRLLMLHEKFLELVTFEGLDPKTVHEALCVVPEYRANLIWNGLGAHIPDDLRNEDAEEAVIERNPIYHGDRGEYLGKLA